MRELIELFKERRERELISPHARDDVVALEENPVAKPTKGINENDLKESIETHLAQ